MSSIIARWWLRRGPDLVLVANGEATPEERQKASGRGEGLGLFQAWRSERYGDLDRAFLLEIVETTSGAAGDWRRAPPAALLRWLADEIEVGRLLLVPAAVARPVYVMTAEREPAVAVPPASSAKLAPPPRRPSADSWVEVELVDDTGASVVANYTIKLTDGNTVRGSSADGKIRMEGIPPGQCQVTFPEIDSDEISPG